MGCYNGAEICEMTGSYIQYLLSDIIDKDQCGLYRDDGLLTVQNLSGPDIERLKKHIVKIFKKCGLNITIQANLHILNILYVQYDMTKVTYKPYTKPDNTPVTTGNCKTHF